MKTHLFWPSRAWAILGATLAAGTAHASTLYDPSAGTLPSSQGWTFVDFTGAAQVSNNLLSLSSAGLNQLHNGLARTDQTINSTQGTQLDFSVQTLTESHSRDNRAGFSVILLDSQHQGIELGFWTDQIWAQSGADFLHAETASFATTTLTQYSLLLQGSTYTLSANGTSLLSGAMRDYSSFGSVYTQSNFIYLGDDTTSAQASVKLGTISVATISAAIPEPESSALWLGGLGLLGLTRLRRAAQRCLN